MCSTTNRKALWLVQTRPGGPWSVGGARLRRWEEPQVPRCPASTGHSPLSDVELRTAVNPGSMTAQKDGLQRQRL